MTDLPPPPGSSAPPPPRGQLPPPPADDRGKSPLWRRRWFQITAGVIVVLLIIGAISGGNADDSPDSDDTAGEETTTSADASNEAADEPAAEEADDTSTTTTEAAPTTTEPELETFSGGDHVVGTDIEPGVYRGEASGGVVAYCAISQDDNGEIVDLRNADEGSVIFTVQDIPGSVVTIQSCENVTLAANVLRTNPQTITNGDWLVGDELPPGRYRGTVDPDAIVQYGAISQTNGTEVIDLSNADEGSIVFDVADVPGSVANFQGLIDIQLVT